MRRLLGFVVAIAAILWVGLAHAAFTPPPLNGHVVDAAGVLTSAQAARLDRKLENARLQNGFAVVVFIPSSLEGESIEDVAYTTFNTWKVGSKKGDDGVLLVIAPQEHKTRIETGKGVGGALTDVQSSHINRDVINPRLQQQDYYGAINQGTDAILQALVEGTPGGVSDPGRGPSTRGPPGNGPNASPIPQWARTGAVIGVVLLVIILAIVSPTFREILFWVLLFGRFGGGGGGGRGGGGGGGYGRGGGSSGGGGSSDDW